VGFSQFGGEPLAVVDLHTLITGEEARIHHAATVILGRGSKGGRTVIGLAADEALRVVRIERQGAETRSGAAVESTRTLDGEPVSVLDTSVLLDDQRMGTEAPHG
jgi:chemotaxis signal transduction protein